MTGQAYEIIDVDANTPEWLEARKRGICASDTPNLMAPGEAFGSPYTVYASKVFDYVKPENTAMRLGHLLEPVVAFEYHKHNPHNRIEPAGKLLRSKQYPWLLATPDYWAFVEGLDLAVLEIKTTHERYLDKWRIQIPIAYQWQVQQQLLVTGLEIAFVAVGFVKAEAYPYFERHGNLDGFAEPVSVVHALIQADPAMQSEIVQKTKAFWFNYVQAKKPPEEG